MHIKCRNWPRLPVACGDKHSILSGKGIRGQPLDVPVPYNSGLAQEGGKGEVRGTGNTQLTYLHSKLKQEQKCKRKNIYIPVCTISEPNIMSMDEKTSSMPSHIKKQLHYK